MKAKTISLIIIYYIMDNFAVSLNNMRKIFQGFQAVDNVTLEIEAGEIFGLSRTQRSRQEHYN